MIVVKKFIFGEMSNRQNVYIYVKVEKKGLINLDLGYDYVVVGAGPTGCSIARLLINKGKRVLILEATSYVGGATRTELRDGIQVHLHGPHIFHTSNKKVWDFINRFSNMMPFVNSPIANYRGTLYNLPFNLNTFYEISLGAVTDPESAKKFVYDDINSYQKEHPNFNRDDPKNLEEKAISMVGPTIFNRLVKEYTEKQWGKSCSELPMSIINRLPIRFTFDNNYFNDIYQGIPENGYSKLFENMIEDIDIKFNINVNKELLDSILENSHNVKIIYTGAVDKFYNYELGDMPFRSLKFEHTKLPVTNFQGVAVMNYTSHHKPYTRVTEHKHFDRNCKTDETWITFEYPDNNVTRDSLPYYPIENKLYQKYRDKLDNEYNGRIILAGRAGLWKYLDMDKIIEESFKLVENLAK